MRVSPLIGALAALVLVAGLVGPASAQPPQPQLQYTFDPNSGDTPDLITDRSGHNYDGKSITSSETTFVAGPAGNTNAVHFDCEDNDDSTKGSGISTGVDTQAIGIAFSDFTTMAWVNRDVLKGDNMVFGTGSDEGVNVGSLHLGFRGIQAYMGFWGNDSHTNDSFKAHEWHHLAWRYSQDTGNQDIFIDGVLKNSSANHGAFGSTRILLVGRTSYNSGAFCGSIADARVYNVALTDADIAAIAATPP